MVRADDAGLTRGDGVFDTCRVVAATVPGGSPRVAHLDRHLARFARSAAMLGLPEPSLRDWEELVAGALAEWHEPGDASLRLILTRGPGTGIPTGLLLLTAVDQDEMARARAGLRVVTLSSGRASDVFAQAPWLLGGAKSLSYGFNVAARREAHARGADDVIFVSTDGYALEAPNAGLLVARAGTLIAVPTAGTGVLESITVSVILKSIGLGGQAGEFRSVARALLRPADLLASDGAWLVSTVRGVCPVLTLDGTPMEHDPELTADLARRAGFGGDPIPR